MKHLRVALLLVFAFLTAATAATLRDQLALADTADDRMSQIEIIRRILEREPKDAALHERLADLWIAISDYDMAEKTIAEWKDVPEAVKASIMADVLYYRDDKQAEAVKMLQDYHAKAPTDGVITRQLVGYLVTMKENRQLADLLKDTAETKENTDLFVDRAIAGRNLNDYEKALADFAIAKRLDDTLSDVTSNAAGFDRLAAGAPGLRASALTLKQKPGDFAGYLSLAYWYLYAGFGNEPAFEAAQAAYKLHPDSAAATLLYAKAAYGDDKVTVAQARDDLAVDVSGPLPDSKTVQTIVLCDLALLEKPQDINALLSRSFALNDSPAQYRLALRSSDAALAIDPKNAGARLERMYSLVKLGDAAGAEAEYNKRDPSKTSATQSAVGASYLVDAMFTSSRFAAALDYANRAISLKPTAQYYKQRAAVLQKLNRAPEADADLVKAQSLEKKAAR